MEILRMSLGGGHHSLDFRGLICLENLLSAWEEFKRGKNKRKDVIKFGYSLEDSLFKLHHDLKQGIWTPDPYTDFFVRDPKLRHIHKATVRDRVLHHALFRILYQVFDKSFIHDSYSCRLGKGTHRGVLRLESMIRKLSSNYKKPVYALKCDVKKFFNTISHEILMTQISTKVNDKNILRVIELLVRSFECANEKGLPLGNVTSQLFANVYLNDFDQFVKHILKIKYYARYCDDFIILSEDSNELKKLIFQIDLFLKENLKLNLHPNKVYIRNVRHGIDFLGYIILPYQIVLRKTTERRILRKVKMLKLHYEQGVVSPETFMGSIRSYLGVVSHCKGRKIAKKIEKLSGVTLFS